MIFRILLKLYDPLWTNETAMTTRERHSPYTVVCSERVDNRVFDLLVELMCIKVYKCPLFDYQHFFSLFIAFTGERVFKWKTGHDIEPAFFISSQLTTDVKAMASRYILASPKSAIFTWPVLETRIFCGFKSLWTMRWECRKSTPFNSWCVMSW